MLTISKWSLNMPTMSGHTSAIAASKFSGTSVYNSDGEHIGQVEDIVLDKMSDKILFAVLGFGGFLGMGEKFHAMPWSMLDYDEDFGGYVVSLDRAALENAPAYDMKDLIDNDGTARTPAMDYYARYTV
jgi:sporulation protein YlmC with PRC-barrel domain